LELQGIGDNAGNLCEIGPGVYESKDVAVLPIPRHTKREEWARATIAKRITVGWHSVVNGKGLPVG
jgi:hypothetical protein